MHRFLIFYKIVHGCALQPGNHARIQEFSSGGRVQASLTKKKSSDNVFFWSSAYFNEVKLLIFKEIYNFLRLQRGSNIFQGGGGVQLFPGGGVQLLIPYRNPYNL